MDRAYSPLSTTLANPFVFSLHQFAQYGRSFVLAGAITLLLVLAMSGLIATDYTEPGIENTPPIKPVVLPELKRTENLWQPPVKPKAVETPPPAPAVRDSIDPVDTKIHMAPPMPDDSTTGPVAVSMDPLPVFKPAPRYPSVALRRGIEGYVVVEFTITRSGGVRDVHAVAGYDSAGNPTDIFNRSAVAAAARFKYQPQLDDGVPVERHGVRNRITYKMAD